MHVGSSPVVCHLSVLSHNTKYKICTPENELIDLASGKSFFFLFYVVFAEEMYSREWCIHLTVEKLFCLLPQ